MERMFQFYPSSIKRIRPELVTRFIIGFNSTLVQLKDEPYTYNFDWYSGFQFYPSSIKSIMENKVVTTDLPVSILP